jgi:DNA-directed RNA polymerase specialized sigma24 family protein
VIFDRLVRRDGLEPEHARELLGAPLEWMSLLSRTCPRGPTRPTGFVDIEAAKTHRSPAADPHTVLMEQYHAKQGMELGQQLERALCSLPVADQVLVRMRHEQGLKVSRIATMLGVDQKKLYRRLDAIHDDLRSAIKAMGVSRGDATELTASHISHLPTFFSGGRAVA